MARPAWAMGSCLGDRLQLGCQSTRAKTTVSDFPAQLRCQLALPYGGQCLDLSLQLDLPSNLLLNVDITF